MSTTGGKAGAAKVIDLAQVSPPRLFFALLHQRFTGVAQLEQGEPTPGSRAIWFAGGMPVFTDWVEQTEVLGQVLVEQRYIDEGTLMKALGAMAQNGGLLGQTLLRLGLIDEDALSDGLRLQCARKLVSVFGLRSSPVTLTACDHPLKEMAPVNVLELILTAVGKHYDEERVRDEMGPALDGELRATAAYTRYRDHFRFRPTDDALLDALLSGVTMDQLSSLPGASRRRGAQLVYVLWACQMLRVGAAALQTPATRQQPMPGNMRQTPRATPHVTPPVDPATPRRASRPSTHEIPSSGASETQRATTTETRPTGTGQTKRPATTEVERGSRETPRTERSTRDLTSTVDEPTFVQELVEFEEKIEAGAHAFDLLGVSLGAGKREVRRRWADLSRRLHPDALEAKGWGHLRDRVGNVFAALSEAQMLLSDKDQRQRLAEQLERGEDPASTDATATVRAAFEAEIIGKDADRFLKASKFDRALAKYDEAMTINSGEPDFRAAAAWCRYQLSPKARPDGQTAERALADVIKEAPALARAYYFRGMVLKDLRAYEPAAAAFHEALRLDSRMIDAERQLRALKAAVKRR